MKEFFILEGMYLIFAAIILLITAFVTTREFMSKNAFKVGFSLVFIILVLAIGAHYLVTKKRMESVIEAFNNNKPILCENRIYTKGANYIEILKSRDWSLKDNNFYSPYYNRPFFAARCIVK